MRSAIHLTPAGPNDSGATDPSEGFVRFPVAGGSATCRIVWFSSLLTPALFAEHVRGFEVIGQDGDSQRRVAPAVSYVGVRTCRQQPLRCFYMVGLYGQMQRSVAVFVLKIGVLATIQQRGESGLRIGLPERAEDRRGQQHIADVPKFNDQNVRKPHESR